MAYQFTHRIHKIDDLTLYNLFHDLDMVFEDHEAVMRFFLMTSYPVEVDDSNDLSGRYSFQAATFSVEVENQVNFTCTFRRTLTGEGNKQVPSPTYDEILVNFAGQRHNEWINYPGKVLSVNQIVTQLDLPIKSDAAIGDADTFRELISGFAAVHRQMLDNLNTTITTIEEKRADVEANFAKSEAERLDDHRKKLDELEAERQKLHLQSYRSERRKIMQQTIDSKVSTIRQSLVPKEARLSRIMVVILLFSVGILAGTFALQSIDSIQQEGASISLNQTLIWYLIGKATVSSMVAFGSLIYAVNWLKSTSQSDIVHARDIDRFNYDMVRSSWIIETVLEAKEEHDIDVPDAWIEGATRGMFGGAETDHVADGDLGALRALFGLSASASFGPDGPKIELGRRSLQKLSKAMKGDDEHPV